MLKRIAFVAAVICFGSSMAHADTAPRHKVFIYHSNSGHWCGLTDQTAYGEKVKKHSGSIREDYLVYLQPTIWFDGPTVRKITTYYYTVDYEFDITTTYYLRADGRVRSAKLVFRPIAPDHGNYRVDRYVVRDGQYIRQNNVGLEEFDFTKAAALSEFPYFKVISKYQSAWTGEEVCE